MKQPPAEFRFGRGAPKAPLCAERITALRGRSPKACARRGAWRGGMKKTKRVTGTDVKNAGGLLKLIDKLIKDVNTGTMDAKEKAANALLSLIHI